MACLLLSHMEKVFITHGVNDDYRSDGRSNIDYRPMEVETDVVSHASGSARLRLANTDILVGVKTEIDTPNTDSPHMANATPEFEGRGGEALASSIANMMQRAYHSAQAFDLTQLCILPAKQCWKLYVDILILECGGNLCDAVSLAAKAALASTRLPLVTAALLDAGRVDLTLADDPARARALAAAHAPLLVTLCKIGERCVVDPTAEEESCSAVSLVAAFTGGAGAGAGAGGRCSAVALSGAGSVSGATLRAALAQGLKAAKSLDEALARALMRETEENTTLKKHSYGFLK